MEKTQNIKSNKYANYVASFDFFGIAPKLYVGNKEKYQTRFGALMSLVLLLFVLVACWLYGKDMYYKNNPQTTFSEIITKHPKRFDVTKNTFNFAVGLQGYDWIHYMDESIYQIKLSQNILTMKKNSEGIVESKFASKDLKARPCRNDDFQIDTQYFHNIYGLEQMYCIDDLNDVFIEGDYGSEVYSIITGSFFPCNNATSSITCQTPEKIQEILQDNYYAIYFSDQILNPKDYEQPFTSTGRSIYGFSNGNMYKQIDMSFRNIFLEDNTGIIFDSIQNKKGLSFSYDREFTKMSQAKNGIFCQFNLRFEKVKETKVYRTYLNLAEVIAKVGGVLKVLMVIFMIISMHFSSQIFNLQLINSVFSFSYDDKSIKKQKRDDQNQDKNKNQFENNDDIKNKNSKHIKYRKLNSSNYFSVFFKCCKQRNQSQQQKLLKFALDRVSSHLNLNSILNKLMEIEKLKMLLLTEDQQRLFSYIPKPLISDQIVDKKSREKNNSQRQEQSKSIAQNIIIQDEQIQDDSPLRNKKICQRFNNLLLEGNEEVEDKNKMALDAFKKISKKKFKKKFDLKILDLMDREMYCYFKTQLGENYTQEYDEDDPYYHRKRFLNSQQMQSQDTGDVYNSLQDNIQQIPNKLGYMDRSYNITQESQRINRSQFKLNAAITRKSDEQQLMQISEEKEKNKKLLSNYELPNSIDQQDLNQANTIDNQLSFRCTSQQQNGSIDKQDYLNICDYSKNSVLDEVESMQYSQRNNLREFVHIKMQDLGSNSNKSNYIGQKTDIFNDNNMMQNDTVLQKEINDAI